MKKQNRGFSAFIFFSAAIVFFVLLFSTCKTPPALSAKLDPFTLFDSEADIYINIPVRGNEKLVRSLIDVFMQDIDANALSVLIERTDSIAAAFFDNSSLAFKAKPSFQFAAVGRYPSVYVSAALSKKNGWTKIQEKIDGLIFERRRHISGIELANPANGIILVSNKNLLPMQQRFIQAIFENTKRDLNWPSSVSAGVSIRNLLDDPVDAALYMPKAGSFLPRMVGSPLELAIDYAFGTLRSYREDLALLRLSLQMLDARALKIASSLFKFAVLGTALTIEQAPNNMLILDNLVIEPSALAGYISGK